MSETRINRPLLEALIGPDFDDMPIQEVRQALKEKGIDVENMYQELEMSDAYVNTWSDTSTNLEHVGFHSHAYYEILCIQSNMQYLLESERYQITRGDIVFIPPNTGHMPLLENISEPYLRYVLWVSVAFAQNLRSEFSDLDLLPTEPFVLHPNESEKDQINRLFLRGIHEGEHGEIGWHSALVGNSVVLLTELARVRAQRELVPSTDERGLTDAILHYIEENLTSDITLHTAAVDLEASEDSISIQLRRSLNVTFHKLLTLRRLVAAKTLLQQGERSEITAAKVGFRDYSAFYRAFKNEYNISPSAYREHMRG